MAPVFNDKRLHRRNINEPGHAHELTFSCYHGYPFLSRDRTCEWLIESIHKARKAVDFAVWAWVIMPEHVHLIVYPRYKVYDTAVIRRLIKEPVATNAIQYLKEHAPEWLPKITRMRGHKTEHHFWQSGGGYDRNVTDGTTLIKMIDYIHMNPVRRGLVEFAHEWKWSSAAWFRDMSDVPLMPDPIPSEWLMDTRLGP